MTAVLISSSQFLSAVFIPFMPEPLCLNTSAFLTRINCIVIVFFRHDCQDGSDENDCLFGNHEIDREFWCFSGDEEVPPCFHHLS